MVKHKTRGTRHAAIRAPAPRSWVHSISGQRPWSASTSLHAPLSIPSLTAPSTGTGWPESCRSASRRSRSPCTVGGCRGDLVGRPVSWGREIRAKTGEPHRVSLQRAPLGLNRIRRDVPVGRQAVPEGARRLACGSVSSHGNIGQHTVSHWSKTPHGRKYPR